MGHLARMQTLPTYHWRRHCPRWSCKITLTWRFLGSFSLYNESLINQACLVQYRENIGPHFCCDQTILSRLWTNIILVDSLCLVNTCKIHLSASNLVQMVLYKMLMVFYGTYYLITNLLVQSMSSDTWKLMSRNCFFPYSNFYSRPVLSLSN